MRRRIPLGLLAENAAVAAFVVAFAVLTWIAGISVVIEAVRILLRGARP